MALTIRGVKGSALTHDEMDDNINTIGSSYDAANAVEQKIHGGRYSASGAAALPTGWSIAFIDNGVWEITHNFNNTDYTVTALASVAITGPEYANFTYMSNRGVNSFEIVTSNITGYSQNAAVVFQVEQFR